jgi:hypothetical protein
MKNIKYTQMVSHLGHLTSVNLVFSLWSFVKDPCHLAEHHEALNK